MEYDERISPQVLTFAGAGSKPALWLRIQGGFSALFPNFCSKKQEISGVQK
jgi:hypothetical protein